MICSQRIDELVECARRGESQSLLSRELRAHVALCTQCGERWEAERQLTAQLRVIRMRTADLRSPETGRAVLMRDFACTQRRRPAVASWAWTLSAAAALLMAVFVGHEAGKKPIHTALPASRTHGVPTEQTVLYEASADADALSSEDFIAVPYTPPLAPGEMVRVVHADLYPEALANMGVEVDPLWAGELPADVVVGEDGLPRAVRIAENGQF